jgi:hypothetical protein
MLPLPAYEREELIRSHKISEKTCSQYEYPTCLNISEHRIRAKHDEVSRIVVV